MADVTTKAAHAKPALKDHLWVLAVIAGFALFDVWESWTQLGNKSGFAHGTGWTLTVIVEAYAGYALFAWFNTPGRRSRRFAMWSAFGVLGLSLIGQGSSTLAAHATPPLWLAVFVKDLPVVVLALIAILIHLRRLDRGEAAAAELAHAEAAQEAAEEAAATDERTALRAELEAQREASHAELETLRDELEAATDVLTTAQNELAKAGARAESLAAKVEAMSAQRKRKRAAQKPPAKSAQEDDLTTEMRALTEMEKDPSLRGPRMGGELARRLRVSAATGRRLHTKLTTEDGPGESLSDHPEGQSDERSGERS